MRRQPVANDLWTHHSGNTVHCPVHQAPISGCQVSQVFLWVRDGHGIEIQSPQQPWTLPAYWMCLINAVPPKRNTSGVNEPWRHHCTKATTLSSSIRVTFIINIHRRTARRKRKHQWMFPTSLGQTISLGNRSKRSECRRVTPTFYHSCLQVQSLATELYIQHCFSVHRKVNFIIN